MLPFVADGKEELRGGIAREIGWKEESPEGTLYAHAGGALRCGKARCGSPVGEEKGGSEEKK